MKIVAFYFVNNEISENEKKENKIGSISEAKNKSN